MKLLFLITEDWYFWSHRLPLARAARDAGFEVIIATHVQDYEERIIQEGFKLIPIKLRRLNRNLFKELLSIFEIIKIYRYEKPDLVHHVAIKAAIYGTLAARVVRIPAIINAFAGMGYIFSSSQTQAKVLKPFIKMVLRLLMNVPSVRGIIQNPEDQELLVNAKILKEENSYLIRGSGVDPDRFLMKPELPGIPLIILASRMLWDKGVGEFVGAAKDLIKSGTRARFALIGKVDSVNPTSIPMDKLEKWKEEGIVEWWGYREDMPKIISQSHIICLPSYYGEGVPKILIEAASCGRAIVTTNTPGCREIVKDGENGYLVPPRDMKALAIAIRQLIDNPSLREKMGKRGRDIVKKYFTIDRVVSETMTVYKKALMITKHN